MNLSLCLVSTRHSTQFLYVSPRGAQKQISFNPSKLLIIIRLKVAQGMSKFQSKGPNCIAQSLAIDEFLRLEAQRIFKSRLERIISKVFNVIFDTGHASEARKLHPSLVET